MKTPEEIKIGLGDLNQKLLQGFVDNSPITPEEAVELVRIAESVANYQQVSKSLCGKENATLDEVLQAIAQVKSELETVKREMDAAVKDLSMGMRCDACKKFFKNNNNVGCSGGLYCIPFRFEWRGICPENTEVQK